MQPGQEIEQFDRACEEKATGEIPETDKAETEVAKSENQTQPNLPTSALSSIVLDKDRNEEAKAQYEPIKHKGSGTFGVVSKAKDKKTKKYVALKKVEYNVHKASSEFLTLKELDHPNCIGVVDSFVSEEDTKNGKKVYLTIVMQYIPDDLCRIISHFHKSGKPIPDTLAMIYSYQLFRVLHYFRIKGLMHRDLKPSNILVDTKNHQIFVCDFGSAEKVNKKRKFVSYICSRYYRAPELLFGNPIYDTAVDMWSVGCIIAELFLREPIFAGNCTKQQIERIIQVQGIPDDSDLKSLGASSLEGFSMVRATTLKKRLQEKASPQCIDLLSKVLVWDPDKRIKPIDAMLHPYFDELRRRKIMINKEQITDLHNFQPEEIAGFESLIKKLTPNWY